MRFFFLLFVFAACGYANAPSHWPSRGALLCSVINYTPQVLEVVQQDGAGRTMPFGLPIGPGQQTCARWGFIHHEGRMGYVVGTDTTWGPWLKPWNLP